MDNEENEIEEVESQMAFDLNILGVRLKQAKELVVEAILQSVRLWKELHPDDPGQFEPDFDKVIYLDNITSISTDGKLTYGVKKNAEWGAKTTEAPGLRTATLLEAPIESLIDIVSKLDKLGE